MNTTAAELWPYYRGWYKVYVEDAALRDRIAGWKDCRLSNTYYNRRFRVIAWDLIVPAKLHDRVAELCGLPLRKKAPRRVAHGKRLGARAKARGYLGVTKRVNLPREEREEHDDAAATEAIRTL